MTNPYRLVLAAFLFTRLASYFFLTTATEPDLYRGYAVAVNDRSLAELYRGSLTRIDPITDRPVEQSPEYPQLTALFLTPPLWLAEAAPGIASLVRYRPRTADHSPEVQAYEAALGLQIFAADALLLAAVFVAARRLYPEDTRPVRAARLGLYVAGSAICAPVWFDRLDMVVGLVAVVAVLAFARGRHALAYAILVLGSAFKVVPLVLLPVWVLAAARRSERDFHRELLRQSLTAGVILAAGVGLLVLLGGGDRAFVFLAPHGARGIQPESSYGPFVILANPTTATLFNYGGFHLTGPLADRLAPATTLTLAALLALALIVGNRAFATASAAELPRKLVGVAVLMWLAFLLGAKVGSPQYVIWLTPLVPLLPLETSGSRRWAAWFLMLCSLMTLIYPFAYIQIFGPMLANDPPRWAGPTPFGKALILARTAVIAGLAFTLAIRLWRRPR